MFALVITTDGRGTYLEQAVESLRARLDPWPEHRFLVDDSGDYVYRQTLAETYGDRFDLVSHPRRLGFMATVKDAWTHVAATDADYIFHAEDDFTYNEPVDLSALAAMLDANPYLAQLTLKRQPVNHDEREAGDIALRDPSAWTQRDGFCEYATNFTTNPSLIPRRVIDLVLDAGIEPAEMEVTWLLQRHGYRFGYLGEINDPPRAEHIGVHRANGWFE